MFERIFLVFPWMKFYGTLGLFLLFLCRGAFWKNLTSWVDDVCQFERMITKIGTSYCFVFERDHKIFGNFWCFLEEFWRFLVFSVWKRLKEIWELLVSCFWKNLKESSESPMSLSAEISLILASTSPAYPPVTFLEGISFAKISLFLPSTSPAHPPLFSQRICHLPK